MKKRDRKLSVLRASGLPGFKLDGNVRLDAMALNIANDDDHPNKMPFSGVLTRVGEPSDEAPHGSGGRRVLVSAEAAEKALASLLGMAVDYSPGFDGHDPQAKIGIITGARVEGDAIVIDGFIYAADFPDLAAEIKANKDSLGFSFEAREIYTDDPDANPIRIVECVFTGAAILRKDKAAYHTTSINAQKEDFFMSEAFEAAMKALADKVEAFGEKFEALSASVEEMKKQPVPAKVEASAADVVEPHAKALDNVASGMECAGVGNDPNTGHAAVARKMAMHLRTSAAGGRIPHVYQTGDLYNASAEKSDEKVAELTSKLAELGTQLADLKAAAVRNAPAPERKTVKPEIVALLAKAGLTAPAAEGEKFTAHTVDAALKDFPLGERIKVKTALARSNLMD